MPKILVLGAGFAGVRAALDLSGYFKAGEVSLISEQDSHCYIPDIYELLTVKLKKEKKIDFKNLFGTVNIPLKSIFAKGRVKVIKNRVSGINLEKKTVSTSDYKYKYDYLVIALGSSTCYYNIPGAWEYSHPLKNVEDALNIRNDLEERLSNLPKREKLKVVVAGGGFTGVEASGILSDFLKDRGKVVVLEAGENLLTGMPSWAQKEAKIRLRELGVEVRLNCRIAQVREGEIVCLERESPKFDYLIWTTGVQGEELRYGIKGTLLNKKGQLVTREDLSLENYPEVFVCGDFSSFEYSKDRYVPAAAWAAIGEAKIAAKNIKALDEGRKTRPYNPPNAAFVVPIGGDFGLTNALHLRMDGFKPMILKQLIALRYFLSILPPFKALKFWIRGVRILS